jgi:bifunctional UDP-N-acetylglucosamine pyrophosphorylase/glucosamine-1-phosphate N-acetyltransferase
VLCARDTLSLAAGSLLVLSGDTPLITSETIAGLVAMRETSGSAATILTTHLTDPAGYGRIERNSDGEVAAIVEEKDCTPEQRAITEVNTGTYCFDVGALFAHLDRLTTENAQGEYYLTDIVALFVAEGLTVSAMATDDPLETMGVNTRVQLAQASKALQARINMRHLLAGVTMVDPDLVWIAPRVVIERDVELLPMTFLMGETIVRTGALIGPNSRVTDSEVGPDAVVDSSILISAVVGPRATVGPVAYLRPGAVLEAGAKAGTCVEIKNSVVGEGSKVPHLSYIGDATIGRGANVGAGTITCNYDGRNKHKTVIEDGAFIGSDTMLVAPVRVGARAVIGAGSAITCDVPADSLAIERSEQRVIDGWSLRRNRQSE